MRNPDQRLRHRQGKPLPSKYNTKYIKEERNTVFYLIKSMLRVLENGFTDINIGITEQIIDGMCTDKTDLIDFGGKGARVNYSAQL